MTDEETHHEIL